MRHSGAARLPTYLSERSVIGFVNEHVCLQLEGRIFGYWLVDHFRRADLDELTRMAAETAGRGTPYVVVVLIEQLTEYDRDLRTVMTDPGPLASMRAAETIIVSSNPIARMVIKTISLAGRATGSPGGAIAAASSYAEAMTRARVVEKEASRAHGRGHSS